jgi:hypothetical protein
MCILILVPSAVIGSQRLPYSDGLLAYQESNVSLSSTTEHPLEGALGGQDNQYAFASPFAIPHKKHYLSMKCGNVCRCGIDGGH